MIFFCRIGGATFADVVFFKSSGLPPSIYSGNWAVYFYWLFLLVLDVVSLAMHLLHSCWP